jgi:hypothetical protein
MIARPRIGMARQRLVGEAEVAQGVMPQTDRAG